jgi:hypothetical protein
VPSLPLPQSQRECHGYKCDVDDLGWSCCRCVVLDGALDFDFEIAGHDVVVINVVLIVVGVAAFTRGTKIV